MERTEERGCFRGNTKDNLLASLRRKTEDEEGECLRGRGKAERKGRREALSLTG